MSNEPRYAHQVAPMPDGHDFFDSNYPVEALVVDMAKHHIARAYGFMAVAMDATHPRMAEAVNHFLPAYELASIWFRLACTDTHDPEQIAVDVVTDLVSPQVLGPNVHELLDWADIAPESIRPYMTEVSS